MNPSVPRPKLAAYTLTRENGPDINPNLKPQAHHVGQDVLFGKDLGLFGFSQLLQVGVSPVQQKEDQETELEGQRTPDQRPDPPK